MFDSGKPLAALFDLDGVVIDTEGQYTAFWHGVCKKYLGNGGICMQIKGQTLDSIFSAFFIGQKETQQKITEELDAFEANMDMPFISGVKDFVYDIKKHNVKTAIVTSSNELKMNAVLKKHPDMAFLFDFVLTAEMFSHSKPSPAPYLLGAERCGSPQCNSFVFEDSLNGLASGRAAGMTVIGLSTTNSAEKITHLADLVIPDFTALDYNKMIKASSRAQH